MTNGYDKRRHLFCNVCFFSFPFPFVTLNLSNTCQVSDLDSYPKRLFNKLRLGPSLFLVLSGLLVISPSKALFHAPFS